MHIGGSAVVLQRLVVLTHIEVDDSDIAQNERLLRTIAKRVENGQGLLILLERLFKPQLRLVEVPQFVVDRAHTRTIAEGTPNGERPS